MEVIEDRSIAVGSARGITLRESVALLLVFFALQFGVFALGPGDPDAGTPAAWNVLLSTFAAALGVVLVSPLVSTKRLFIRGLDGVGVVRLPSKRIAACLLSGVLLGGIVLAALPFFDNGATPNPMMGQIFLEGSVSILIAWMASLVVAAPIGEELVFRGFLLPALAGKIGTSLAVAVAALLFLLIHVPQIDGSWGAAASIFSLGVLAGVARARTGSLFAAIAVHSSYNATILVYMLWERFVG